MRRLGGILLLALFACSDVYASEVRVRVFSTSQKVTVSNNFELIYEGLDPQTMSEPLEIRGNLLRINAQSVPSHIILYPKRDSIDVVAVLNERDYLRGVIPHEMPLSWPLEALKAQAIVARSFTRLQVRARKTHHYHLDSTVNDQVYRYNQINNPKEIETLNRVLEETKDEVLTTQNGQIVRALYHADCGGQTEKASEVWGQKEVEFSVKDSKCPATPFANWEYEISTQELQQKLKMEFVPKKVSISAQSLSQRAAQMEIVGLNSEREKLSSQNFRKLLGYSKLKSTKFEVRKTEEGFLFKGSGFGHGVGLCQWGARAWAKSGVNYKDILKHYFPSYNLSKLSSN